MYSSSRYMHRLISTRQENALLTVAVDPQRQGVALWVWPVGTEIGTIEPDDAQAALRGIALCHMILGLMAQPRKQIGEIRA